MNRYKYVEVPLTDAQIELRKRFRDEEIQELRDRIKELEEREIDTHTTEMICVVPGEEGYDESPYSENSIEVHMWKHTEAIQNFACEQIGRNSDKIPLA